MPQAESDITINLRGVHMKLIWRNGCAVAIAVFATQMWNSSISTFNKTGLKGHCHYPCRRYHKGSGVFLLVKVGGVDDIAVDLLFSRDDGLQKHNCDGSYK